MTEFRATLKWPFDPAHVGDVLIAVDRLPDDLADVCIEPQHVPSRVEFDLEIDATGFEDAMRYAAGLVLAAARAADLPGHPAEIVVSTDDAFMTWTYSEGAWRPLRPESPGATR